MMKALHNEEGLPKWLVEIKLEVILRLITLTENMTVKEHKVLLLKQRKNMIQKKMRETFRNIKTVGGNITAIQEILQGCRDNNKHMWAKEKRKRKL